MAIWPQIRLLPKKTNFTYVKFAGFAAFLSVAAVTASLVSMFTGGFRDNPVEVYQRAEGAPLARIGGGKREITPLVFTQVPLYEEISCKFTIGWTEVPSGPVLVFNTTTTPQVHQNVLCKGLLDIVVIDQAKKEIRVFDFKTKSDIRNFHKSFTGFSYGIQGAFYYALIMKAISRAKYGTITEEEKNLEFYKALSELIPEDGMYSVNGFTFLVVDINTGKQLAFPLSQGTLLRFYNGMYNIHDASRVAESARLRPVRAAFQSGPSRLAHSSRWETWDFQFVA